MASLLPLQFPAVLSHHSQSSSSSSSSSLTGLVPRNILRSDRSRVLTRKPDFATRSAVEESAVTESAAAAAAAFGIGEGSKSELTASLKLKLLSVVSGLNKGLAATEEDLRNAEAAASELEAVGKPVDFKVDSEKLQGKWKLIYSSGFSSRTLGGSRPGPPLGRLLPITLGQVFQRIDIVSRDFDNIVELELGAPWPLPPIQLTATLAHKLSFLGTSKVEILFEKTTVKPRGNLSQLPSLDIPNIPYAFRPSSSTGSGVFEVTYLDSDTRITRGDRSELRVFVIA